MDKASFSATLDGSEKSVAHSTRFNGAVDVAACPIRDGQHRNRTRAQDLLGNGAEHQVLERAGAVRADDDQVGREGRRRLDDFLGRQTQSRRARSTSMSGALAVRTNESTSRSYSAFVDLLDHRRRGIRVETRTRPPAQIPANTRTVR